MLFLSLLAIGSSGQHRGSSGNIPAGYFKNSIFVGDYPDPSILYGGYLLRSNFEYYPGLLIWQSKDLINWEPVGNALHKYVGSVWAPDLVKYKNKY